MSNSKTMTEEEKKKWKEKFEKDYGEDFITWTLGIVASALYHQNITPNNDASYITNELRERVTQEKRKQMAEIEADLRLWRPIFYGETITQEDLKVLEDIILNEGACRKCDASKPVLQSDCEACGYNDH